MLPPLILSIPLKVCVAAAISGIGCGVFLTRKNPCSDFGQKALSIGAAGLLGAIFLSLFSVLPTILFFYAPEVFASRWVSIFALIAGIILFELRKRRLDLYGALEILGAVAAIVVCATNSTGTPSQRAMALITATYFLVRGLDNAERGQLKTTLRLAYPSIRRGLLMLLGGAMFMAIVVAGSWGRNSDVKPPYMSNHDGSVIPLSPMWCGGAFVICDESAWRERSRLMQGPESGRKAAEVAANERARLHRVADERAGAARRQNIISWFTGGR